MLRIRKPIPSSFSLQTAQTAVEYLLLLMVVVAIVLVAFRSSIPRARGAAGLFFNRATVGIIGKPNRCGDGLCDNRFEGANKCCVDCPPYCTGFQ